MIDASLRAAFYQNRFPTLIKHVEITGNSGLSVFDAMKRWLLGIMSRSSRQTSRILCRRRSNSSLHEECRVEENLGGADKAP